MATVSDIRAEARKRRTLRDLAREALQVQDACNISGVAHGFARAMSSLCDLGLATDERNRHPITILWVDKLAHLSGYRQDFSSHISDAYAEVSKLASQEGEGR